MVKSMLSLKKPLIVIFLLFSIFVYSEDDGNELLNSCNSLVKHSNGEKLNANEEIGAIICNQYILGFKDSLTLSGDIMGKVCIPEGVMSDQVARVVVKHLKLNPEILHKGRGATLLYSLERGFPCE
jgi:hypothetical protein